MILSLYNAGLCTGIVHSQSERASGGSDAVLAAELSSSIASLQTMSGQLQSVSQPLLDMMMRQDRLDSLRSECCPKVISVCIAIFGCTGIRWSSSASVTRDIHLHARTLTDPIALPASTMKC